MTDKEIIKALECCTKGNTSDVCADCPLRTTDICTEEENGVLKLALDLNNRQQAEIERLEQELFDRSLTIETWKWEAIKEFAERLKNATLPIRIGGQYNYDVISKQSIDHILKEMVGDAE